MIWQTRDLISATICTEIREKFPVKKNELQTVADRRLVRTKGLRPRWGSVFLNNSIFDRVGRSIFRQNRILSASGVHYFAKMASRPRRECNFLK